MIHLLHLNCSPPETGGQQNNTKVKCSPSKTPGQKNNPKVKCSPGKTPGQKNNTRGPETGRQQNDTRGKYCTFINEPGFYELVFSSK